MEDSDDVGGSFRKRVFTPRSFAVSVARVVGRPGRLVAAFTSGRLSKEAVERLMIAVTGVNGCRYCSYVHATNALSAGMAPSEVASLLAGDFGECPEDEAVGLAFARHYAESGGRPDRAASKRLVECYGLKKARDVVAVLDMINVANLGGNTVDAVLARARGARRGRGLLWELAFFTIFGPFLLPFTARAKE